MPMRSKSEACLNSNATSEFRSKACIFPNTFSCLIYRFWPSCHFAFGRPRHGWGLILEQTKYLTLASKCPLNWILLISPPFQPILSRSLFAWWFSTPFSRSSIFSRLYLSNSLSYLDLPHLTICSNVPALQHSSSSPDDSAMRRRLLTSQLPSLTI